jgi:hypothetical protein
MQQQGNRTPCQLVVWVLWVVMVMATHMAWKVLDLVVVLWVLMAAANPMPWKHLDLVV